MNAAEQILVNHLESGRYLQAKGYLQTSEGHCCLGVACDIYNPSIWIEGHDDETEIFKFGTEVYGLSHDLKLWLDWKTSNGVTIIPNKNNIATFYNLAQLNDDGFTFSQIADIIKANLILHNGEQFPATSWPGRDYWEDI